jgi:hypothetical protein
MPRNERGDISTLKNQADLFGSDETGDVADDHQTPVFHADPEEVRAELLEILAVARAAERLPWDASKVALYRTIFPQMTNWLPEDEGAQLRFQFEEELARLEAA